MKPLDANAVRVAHGTKALRDAFDATVAPFTSNTVDPDTEAPAERLPLFPPLPPAEGYPVRALGLVLGNAATAIARKVQVPEAIAAQSVLAVAALAAQPHRDVQLPFGQSRPLSLFLLTIAGSGDRKTTADREALGPVRQHEKSLHELHAAERQAYAVSEAAWQAEKRKVEADRKLTFETRKLALMDLGRPPDPPLWPFLVAPDPTIEGLMKAWSTALPGLGIFTAEGGRFIGGHGMNQENRLRTAAGYSELWDGQPVKRIRSLDGVSLMHGRRLSMHLMVQPEASMQFLANPVLRDQGLLSRILVAAPDSLAGTRRYEEPRAEDESAIRAYNDRILSMLETPWPMGSDRAQGVQPRQVLMSPGATSLWRTFYDEVEDQCGGSGRYSNVRDLAAKIAEHAARIAGVLTLVDEMDAAEIGEEVMGNAVTLASWYLDETARLQQGCRTEIGLTRAQALLTWLLDRGGEVRFADVLQFGPAATRTKKEADAAIEVLKAHGWVEEVSQRPRILHVLGEEGAHA
jgi:hypothetical protein